MTPRARVTPSLPSSRWVRLSVVRQPRVLLQWLMVMALLLSASSALAQSFAGQWRAGVTVMDVKVESWGPDCGPEPRSSRSDSGGTVRLSQEGNEVIIHTRNGDLRTDRCWSRNAAVRRLSSRYLNGEWITECRTPKDDPRAEYGTYTLRKVGDDQLRYIDVSRYNWQLNNSTCVATIRTTQTLERVGQPATPARNATNATPQSSDDRGSERCTPSVPARLVLRPRQAKVELGEEVCFRATVTDALGCVVRGARVQYALSHSDALRGTLQRNCFRSSDNAAEGEGEFHINAAFGELHEQAIVQVSAMDLSDLIAKRLEVGAISGFDEDDEESAEQAVGSATMRVSAETSVERTSGPPVLPLLLALAALLVLVAALVLVRKRQAPATAGTPDPLSVTQLHDAQPPPEEPPAVASSAPPGQAGSPWICPNCRRGFPASQGTCPHCAGGVALMPYSEFVERSRQQETQEKRCRACGATCEGNARFCGDCGSKDLELIG